MSPEVDVPVGRNVMAEAGVDGLDSIRSWALDAANMAGAAADDAGESGEPVGDKVVKGLCKEDGTYPEFMRGNG